MQDHPPNLAHLRGHMHPQHWVRRRTARPPRRARAALDLVLACLIGASGALVSFIGWSGGFRP